MRVVCLTFHVSKLAGTWNNDDTRDFTAMLVLLLARGSKNNLIAKREKYRQPLICTLSRNVTVLDSHQCLTLRICGYARSMAGFRPYSVTSPGSGTIFDIGKEDVDHVVI